MANKYKLRSISLPTRSHPSTEKFEEELRKIRTSHGTTFHTTDRVCKNFSQSENLYDRLDDMLNMGSTQEVLWRNREEKCVDELLDGSLKLLDVCGIARDTLLKFKEEIQCLHFALRKRKLGDSKIFQSSLADYFSFRKKMRKDAKKLIAELKCTRNKIIRISVLDSDHQFTSVIRAMSEFNAINSLMFQFLFLFLASKPRESNRWPLVAKFVAISGEEKQENNPVINELDGIDALLSLGDKTNCAHKKLEALEIGIGDIENCLESTFKRLIKARTSILNILSQ